MDFSQAESRYDLGLDLDRVELSAFPVSWGVSKIGLVGRLTGSARLGMTLTASGLDVTGSRGQGVVESAVLRGLPLGELQLALRGEGRRRVEAPTGIFVPQWIGAEIRVPGVVLDRAPATLGGTGRRVPVSGRLMLAVALQVPLGTLLDVNAYSAQGAMELTDALIGGVQLGRLTGRVDLAAGTLKAHDFEAWLGRYPLYGSLRVCLAGEQPFAGRIVTRGAPLAALVRLAGVSRAGSLDLRGALTGHSDIRGTFQSESYEITGAARIDACAIGRVPLGDLPLQWATKGGMLVVTARELQRYGGRIAAEAHVPLQGSQPIQGTVVLERVDAAQLPAEAPRTLAMSGRADGRARFSLSPTDPASTFEANALLTGSNMTVAGIPAQAARAVLTIHDGVPEFRVTAETMGGAFTLEGGGRLGDRTTENRFDARLRAEGLKLFVVLGALFGASAPTKLDGVASTSLTLSARESLAQLRVRGSAQVRELFWGDGIRLGDARGALTLAPEGWRVGAIEGELLGGRVAGRIASEQVAGTKNRRNEVDLRLEQVPLRNLPGVDPLWARHVEGCGAFRCWGTCEGDFRGRAEFRVHRAEVNHVVIKDLVMPATWLVPWEERGRGFVVVRHGVARVADGHVEAQVRLELGATRQLHATVSVRDVDMRLLSRAVNPTRTTPGRATGYLSVVANDAADLNSYRGRLLLNLRNAVLVDVPVLERLDEKLGEARGGVFAYGDAVATIAHRKLHVERLTLVGPLAQLHATGTINFDTKLNLEVLVNTNDIISQSSQAVLSRVTNAVEATRREQRAIEELTDFLSTRLAKYRITGTVHHPIVTSDGSVPVGKAALGFFLETVNAQRRQRP
jgi:translocation and assembly module TamB